MRDLLVASISPSAPPSVMLNDLSRAFVFHSLPSHHDVHFLGTLKLPNDISTDPLGLLKPKREKRGKSIEQLQLQLKGVIFVYAHLLKTQEPNK